jgi:xylulokinase
MPPILKYTVMNCTLLAGLPLRLLRDTFYEAEVEKAMAMGVDPYELISTLAASVTPVSDRLLFLPYLMGERCPLPDPDCRGVFFGLSAVQPKGAPHSLTYRLGRR